ncbi:hypothetical protein EIP91_004250 [Steccherinum ochraceum]|uniref:Uncharacterized protein n=1 Tax=Steccherinum ochraceum TaxID=92696 RepID=A0A4R0R966_9APHY|nr:hypothetical protein EIP91_004250 [Steccherinum ochraceum]
MSDTLLFDSDPIGPIDFERFPEDDPRFRDVYCDYCINTVVDDLATYHSIKHRTGVPKFHFGRRYLALKGNLAAFSAITKALADLSDDEDYELKITSVLSTEEVIHDDLPRIVLNKTRHRSPTALMPELAQAMQPNDPPPGPFHLKENAMFISERLSSSDRWLYGGATYATSFLIYRTDPADVAITLLRWMQHIADFDPTPFAVTNFTYVATNWATNGVLLFNSGLKPFFDNAQDIADSDGNITLSDLYMLPMTIWSDAFQDKLTFKTQDVQRACYATQTEKQNLARCLIHFLQTPDA